MIVLRKRRNPCSNVAKSLVVSVLAFALALVLVLVLALALVGRVCKSQSGLLGLCRLLERLHALLAVESCDKLL